MTYLFKTFSFVLFCIVSTLLVSVSNADTAMEEIIISSDFRQSQLKNIPTSISVIDAEVIGQRNSRHLEDLLALTPNVNFASGASRGRYFQIRGIGERSQFVAPLNPSVGTYVDGIDFTGFGGAATLLDIDQVEVLRGSQGTRFGANALAGVINLKSADPSAENQGYLKTSASSYNGISVETAVGGLLNDQWLYRAAIGKTASDGFIKNTTLNKKDTNNIDELTSRLKLRYLAADNLTIDFTALHLDIDNGYDAFSLDENRNTMSDQPGHDRQ
jgi:outer membrane receptor protein involved in Fe transport